jgi:hypothetical protein
LDLRGSIDEQPNLLAHHGVIYFLLHRLDFFFQKLGFFHQRTREHPGEGKMNPRRLKSGGVSTRRWRRLFPPKGWARNRSKIAVVENEKSTSLGISTPLTSNHCDRVADLEGSFHHEVRHHPVDPLHGRKTLRGVV